MLFLINQETIITGAYVHCVHNVPACRLSVLFSQSGQVVNSSIDGCIQMKSYLSGESALPRRSSSHMNCLELYKRTPSVTLNFDSTTQMKNANHIIGCL